MRRLKVGSAKSDENGNRGVINLADGYSFYTFDVIGGHGLGEPFNCLRDGGSHPWVSFIFHFLKGMTLAATTRYYSWLEYALMGLIPKSIKQTQKDHYSLALEKIHGRPNLEADRRDFMTTS